MGLRATTSTYRRVRAFRQVAYFDDMYLVRRIVRTTGRISTIRRLVLYSCERIVSNVHAFRINLLLAAFMIMIRRNVTVLSCLNARARINLRFKLRLRRTFITFHRIPTVVHAIREGICPIAMNVTREGASVASFSLVLRSAYVRRVLLVHVGSFLCNGRFVLNGAMASVGFGAWSSGQEDLRASFHVRQYVKDVRLLYGHPME